MIMSDLYKRILVVGANGMLAHAVKRSLARRGLPAELCDRNRWDITDPPQVQAMFKETQPTLVINCAAYTAVDLAEREEELATKVNGDGPRNLAQGCGETGAMLVHYSTDFVFDGKGTQPYRVDDKPDPLSAYGRSKLAGEVAIESTGLADWLTIRTAWLYGPGPGRPFPKVILEAARAGKPLKVIDDQHGSPTFTCDLAETTLDLLDANARGLFHVTGGGRTTWHGFAAAVLEEFGVKPTSFDAIEAAEWSAMKPDSAPRPAFSVLDLSRTEAVIGRPMRHWRAALDDYRLMTAASP